MSKLSCLLTISAILICHKTEFGNFEKFCDNRLDVPKLKTDFYCDNFILNSFNQGYETIKNTNKYLRLKRNTYLRSIEENCTAENSNYKTIDYCEQPTIFRSCKEAVVYGRGNYLIRSLNPKLRPFMVYCTVDEEGSAWTVIQRRRGQRGACFSVGRKWNEYEKGFGDLLNDFWIGLEKIYALTYRGPSELWITFKDRENTTNNVYYDMFGIGTKAEKYALQVLGKFSGDTSDMLRSHLGLKFSTSDAFNEKYTDKKWGGWWFSDNDNCHLNGPYRDKAGNVKNPSKYFWGKYFDPIYYVRMAIRERYDFSNIS